jgi:hypothetical protein
VSRCRSVAWGIGIATFIDRFIDRLGIVTAIGVSIGVRGMTIGGSLGMGIASSFVWRSAHGSYGGRDRSRSIQRAT